MVDAKIINTKEDVLFKRKIVTVEIDLGSATTPSREQVKEIVAKLSNADKSLVLIESIEKAYGKSQAVAIAKIYYDKAVLENTEAEYILKRNKIEKVKEDKKQDSSKEEPKVEEKVANLKDKPKEEALAKEDKQEGSPNA
jgi:small subunit ribosomal protein S24e